MAADRLKREAANALEVANRKRERMRVRHEGERAKLVASQRRELARLDRDIATLTRAARTLGVVAPRKRSAHVQAGPKAIAKVLALIESGVVTQREIVRRSRLNDGTVSYALRALVEDGRVLDAGVDPGSGSRRFRLRVRRRAAA